MRTFHFYALLLGLFLGLCLIKFGNPVILDQAIIPPATLRETLAYAWPVHWAYWGLVPIVLLGVGLGFSLRRSQSFEAGESIHPGKQIGEEPRAVKSPGKSFRLWLTLLPLTWFGWQLVSATHTQDRTLSVAAIAQFGGCLSCYCLGAWLLRTRRAVHWLLVGLLVSFAFVLVRAAEQRLFEFPQERQTLLEGERSGWTNFTPEMRDRLRAERVIVTTNSVEVANPFIMAKYAKGRVHGTLVYPNALAGAVLLLWPISIVMAFTGTRGFRTATRAAIAGLTVLLGGAVLFWTGSKLAWLIGLALLCLWLTLKLSWPRRRKIAVLFAVAAVGAGIFAVRFHGYFAAGAKSAGARLDYWRAAIQIVQAHPILGCGPGSFQRAYVLLKSPEAEMTRMAHNDFLEQFSDSGVPGGLGYLAWIGVAVLTAWRVARRRDDTAMLALWIGLFGWFLQGFGEFGLYIPGAAWPAFTLLGWTCSSQFNSSESHDS